MLDSSDGLNGSIFRTERSKRTRHTEFCLAHFHRLNSGDPVMRITWSVSGQDRTKIWAKAGEEMWQRHQHTKGKYMGLSEHGVPMIPWLITVIIFFSMKWPGFHRSKASDWSPISAEMCGDSVGLVPENHARIIRKHWNSPYLNHFDATFAASSWVPRVVRYWALQSIPRRAATSTQKGCNDAAKILRP
jgi:hypothetical protein